MKKRLKKKGIDLMVVDDNDLVIKSVETIVKAVVTSGTINVIKFDNLTDALRYLRKNTGNLPRGYLIDLGIPSGQEEDASPEGIYRFLEQHRATENFRFFTGEVPERYRELGAKIIEKGYCINELEEFLRGLVRK